MTATAAPARAGIYTRLSLAKFGDTTKVEDQERICRDLCAARGWEVVGDAYCDNNKSAWQRSRKRPGWNKMLADVEGGLINAIVVYHGDRLVRQPWDLETLINLAYGKGIRLASPTGDKDLGNEDHLFILRIEVAAQCRESASTSRRQKAQYERRRRAGLVRPGGRGGRAFAFATDGVTHVPAEADAVREAAARVLAGESVSAVARDLAGRGVLTPAGSKISQNTMRKMLARPRYAGLMPDGISQAAWPPVLERGQWEALAAVLAARGTANPNPSAARRHLLPGIAECGADGCGQPLKVRQASSGGGTRRPQKGYACVAPGCGKVYRSVTHLDEYIAGAVEGRLADPANDAADITSDNAGIVAEIVTLQERRREAEQVIEDLAAHPGQRLDILARSLESFDRRLAELRELAGGDSRARVLARYQGLTREEFKVMPLPERRTIVAAAFRVVVLPTVNRSGRTFQPERIRLVPHGQRPQDRHDG